MIKKLNKSIKHTNIKITVQNKNQRKTKKDQNKCVFQLLLSLVLVLAPIIKNSKEKIDQKGNGVI